MSSRNSNRNKDEGDDPSDLTSFSPLVPVYLFGIVSRGHKGEEKPIFY